MKQMPWVVMDSSIFKQTGWWYIKDVVEMDFYPRHEIGLDDF